MILAHWNYLVVLFFCKATELILSLSDESAIFVFVSIVKSKFDAKLVSLLKKRKSFLSFAEPNFLV
jgi:hypothetical protein